MKHKFIPHRELRL